MLSQLNTEDAFEFYRSFIEWYCTRRLQTSYLEIGCNAGWLTARIAKTATFALGIDIENFSETWAKHLEVNPETLAFEHSSSDDFFKKANGEFDCIFIDGSHEYEQVKKDITNAFAHLNNEGIIVVHDTYPPDEAYTSPNLCGTAWKAIRDLHELNTVQVFTFPVRFGMTILTARLQLLW